MNDLAAALECLAATPRLLVACDFDGTLAPIVDHPADARPIPAAVAALRLLADLPSTRVAVISGRALDELRRLLDAPATIHLVGSHGSEFEAGFAEKLSPEHAGLRRRLLEHAEALAARTPGALVEHKPAGLAFHVRTAPPEAGAAALRELLAGPGAWPGVHARTGKMVAELAVVPTSKGAALERIRTRFGASAALFIGDDLTDEDAFAVLAGPDVGVKVGPGETRAGYRIDGPGDVARLLATLAERRHQLQRSDAPAPIERLAVLSDQRTCALVTPDARIVWLCVPRIDGPAIFAELLGGRGSGSFDVAPVLPAGTPVQSFVPDTFLLRTVWPDVTVTDYLDCSAGRAFQRAGRSDLVRVLEGTGRARIRFAPRADFGRTGTRLAARDGGLEVEGPADPFVLAAPGVEWRIAREGSHDTAEAEVDLASGPVVLELRVGTADLRSPGAGEASRRAQTRRFWEAWAATLQVPELHAPLVRRSALVIKALCYGPTGAIAAAGTTSLPEYPGGVRNWDYRYCWPRDAALAAAALVRLRSTGHAMKLLDWFLGILDAIDAPERLRPLYTVTGHNLPPEGEISELTGYRASRPVRIGNAAAQQVQLDVFGPIVDLVHELVLAGAPITPDHWRLVEAMVLAVDRRWREPDHGIWEIRAERRHHVHSKVMCWLTVDRAIRVGHAVRGTTPARWTALRDEIRADVLARGFDAALNAFPAAYDQPRIDAASLVVLLSGLLPPDDPRAIGTVDAVERELRRGPAVYRYRYDDGLPGNEGAFHLCTGWLIESLAMLGRHEQARALLDAFAGLAGPTGLLPEQYDPETGESLGNHPQAYSHLALINAVLAVAKQG